MTDAKRGRLAPSWRTLALLVAVAALIWVTDFLSKTWVIDTMVEGESRQVLGDWLQWTFVRNPGAAFSLAEGATWIFTILATGVSGFIIWKANQIRTWSWAIAFGLLLGGTLGNLYDRIFRDPAPFVGHVVDFIQVKYFPAIFNVADIGVVSAMCLVVLLVFQGIGLDGKKAEPEQREPVADDTASDDAAGDDAVTGDTAPVDDAAHVDDTAPVDDTAAVNDAAPADDAGTAPDAATDSANSR